MSETEKKPSPEENTNPRAGKVILAEVNVEEGVYNYNYRYGNATEILITVALLEKMKTEMLKVAFPEKKVEEEPKLSKQL